MIVTRRASTPRHSFRRVRRVRNRRVQRGPPSPIPAAGGVARGKTVLAEKAADAIRELQKIAYPGAFGNTKSIPVAKKLGIL